MQFLFVMWQQISSRYFIVVTLLIFLLEILFPLKKGKKLFTYPLFMDSFYILTAPAFMLLADILYTNFLVSFFILHFAPYTFTFMNSVSPTLKIIISYFLFDFLMWSNHWFRHKVPWLWEFHKVHHSQPHINQFTDQRGHLIELFIIKTWFVFFGFLFQLTYPQIMLLFFLNNFVTKFSHARIKGNLGPLRYLFVTPQSHRIHHSKLKKHQDKNFGFVFSFWDYLFRTQYRVYDEYPVTGIHDEDFPLATSGPWAFLKQPVLHFIYPFKVLKKKYWQQQKLLTKIEGNIQET